MKRGPLLILGMLVAPELQAHVAVTESGADEFVVIALLVAVLCLHGAGLLRLWPHARERRDLARRSAAFWLGCALLAILLLGPLDAAAPQSFSLHMIQHEGLMLLAAPLLVWGRAMPLFLWALPHRARLACAPLLQSRGLKSGWQWLTAPLTAWSLHALALWLWHAPVLFNAALRDPTLHEWQHVSFLLSALLFWHAVLRRGSHGAQGMAMVYLFTTTIHTGVLGALLTFARRPLYGSMGQGLVPWLGLTPMEDQQLGGLIMWVPGALVYVGVALCLMARLIGPERAPAGQQA
jgi:putative membrane protein